jgi:hypothetical protein
MEKAMICKAKSPANSRNEIPWVPGYFKKTYEILVETKRKMINICIVLLSGSDKGMVSYSILEDGSELVLKTKVPAIFLEPGLSTLHDISEPVRDTNYHLRLSALCEAINDARSVWGPGNPAIWVA